jgi:hypothetical protein
MRKAIDRSFLSWLLQTTGPSLTLMKGRGRGSCGLGYFSPARPT